MEQTNKIKITQKEIDDLYEIEGITEVKPQDTATPVKGDTTPEFLTHEEEEFDKLLHADLPTEDEDAS